MLALAFGDELLDVVERVVGVGPDRGPVVDAGGDPGFDAGLGERRDVACEALGGVRGVDPGYGDGVLLEGGGEGFEEVGAAFSDVAPEKNFAVQGRERGINLLQKVEVDGAEAARVYVGFGLAEAEIHGFVGADVEEGAGVVGGEFGENLLDVEQRAGLAGGEDGAVGGFGEGAVLLPEKVVVEVAEGFLVGQDDDMVAGGVGGNLAGLSRRYAAAGRRGERVRGVLLGVFEVRGVDVDLVGGEGADQGFLEFKRGDGSAREVVLHATVAHGGVVADGGEVEGGGRAVLLDELEEGLGRVEQPGGGRGLKLEAVGDGGDRVALGGLGGWELGAAELDGKRAGGGDAAGLERVGQLLGGEVVLGLRGAGVAGDVQSGGQRLRRAGMELAGVGDEVQGSALGGALCVKAGHGGQKRQNGCWAEADHDFEGT